MIQNGYLFFLTGDVGSGKTLFLVIESFQLKKPIFSNFIIKNDYVKQLSLKKLFRHEYSNCVIYLDEAYTKLNKRRSMQNENILLTHTLLQTRKTDMFVYIISQMSDIIEIRYREYIFYHEIKCFHIDNYFIYDFYEVRRISKHEMKKTYLFTEYLTEKDAQWYYDKYDSYKSIYDEKLIDSVVMQYLTSNEKQEILNMLFNEFAHSKYNIAKITKQEVISFLKFTEHSKEWSDLLYSEIKIRNDEL